MDTCHSLLWKEGGGGDSTRYNHFMTFFRVEGWAVGHEPKAVSALDVAQALLCNW